MVKKELTDKEKLNILLDYISCLEEDDIENTIRNATRCISEGGTLELKNILADHYYRAGKNQMINELRQAIGLKRLRDKTVREWRRELPRKEESHKDWPCPPLSPQDYDIVDGKAICIPLGEDMSTIAVIGTKSKPKAVRLIRRLQREYHDQWDDELITEQQVESRRLVWRKSDPSKGDDTESSHYFSWSAKYNNNPNAVDCFIAELF